MTGCMIHYSKTSSERVVIAVKLIALCVTTEPRCQLQEDHP